MYLVICESKTGEVIVERNLSDAESWDITVASLAGGEWRDVSRVIRTSDGQDVLPLMLEWIDRKMPPENVREIDLKVLAWDHKRALAKEAV